MTAAELRIEIASLIDGEKRGWDHPSLGEKLNGVTKADTNLVLRSVAGGLASIFAHHNPRFDRRRFLAACGFKE